MNKDLVVHFGCGALGRGLVIPLLYQSGKQIVAVDTNADILSEITRENGYDVMISDTASEASLQHIKIETALSSLTQKQEICRQIKNCKTITTSVKRENLQYLVDLIIKAWGDTSDEGRSIICCENVEKAGEYFGKLLFEKADEEEWKHLSNIRIPNTIVDRICSMDPKDFFIVSESFHECSVDRHILPDTEIACISSVDNLEGHFYRKRYLLNSYADAISFLALQQNKTYLYQAAQDDSIQAEAAGYMQLLKDLLHELYGFEKKELAVWQNLYKNRLCNERIPRNLNTVARNLWGKLTLEERFVKPLVQWHGLHRDCREGLEFVYKLIRAYGDTIGEIVSDAEILERLKILWCINEAGNALYQEMSSLLLQGTQG